MKRLAVIWYWERASQIKPLWRDGITAAIEELEKEFKVDWYLDKNIPEDTYDAIIIWGDSNCPVIGQVASYKAKKGLFLTTNPHHAHNLISLDAIYCESQVVFDEVRSKGLRAIKAFGTDTNFFTPDDTKEKDIKYFYPATFSPWKRQSKIAHLGKDLLCVGTLQPDGLNELQVCQNKDVQVIVDYLPVEQIKDYYQRTQKMIIPAIHGSERTVLETMSCNIVPVVAKENAKAHSYLEEYRKSVFSTPREFVEHTYSAKEYAKNILKGLE